MVDFLVEPSISRRKFRREVEQWVSTAPHAQRGWLLLRCDEEALVVEIAFLGQISLNAGSGPLPTVVCAIRLTYENYDLLPPSLEFIDAFTRAPARPHVRAFVPTPTGPRDVLIDAHPLSLKPFFCMPGNREYHTHPQHTGDSWFLHRERSEGSITTICERVWQTMVRNVVGLNVQMQTLPVWPLQAQLSISIAQGPVDAIRLAQQQLPPVELELQLGAPAPANEAPQAPERARAVPESAVSDSVR